MADTRSGSVLLMTIRRLSGTRSHICPVAITAAASVRPMPAAKAPNAPWVGVCESLPTMIAPGQAWPFSGSTWWQMPSPMS